MVLPTLQLHHIMGHLSPKANVWGWCSEIMDLLINVFSGLSTDSIFYHLHTFLVWRQCVMVCEVGCGRCAWRYPWWLCLLWPNKLWRASTALWGLCYQAEERHGWKWGWQTPVIASHPNSQCWSAPNILFLSFLAPLHLWHGGVTM